MLTLCEFPYCLTYSGVFNYFGFPALNVPMGLDHKGMPLGLQVNGLNLKVTKRKIPKKRFNKNSRYVLEI